MGVSRTFIEPKYDPSYPFRKFFVSDMKVLSLPELIGKLPNSTSIASADIEWIVGSDPLISNTAKGYKMNWTGPEEGLEILRMVQNAVSETYDSEDIPMTMAYQTLKVELADLGIESLDEFYSFLHFDPEIEVTPYINPETLSKMIEVLENEITRPIAPNLQPILSALIDENKYVTFKSIMGSCNIPESDWESMRLDMEGDPRLVHIDDLYKYVGTCAVRQLMAAVKADDEEIFVPQNEHIELVNFYDTEFLRDYRTIRGLEYEFEGCDTATFGKLKKAPILEVNRRRLSNIIGCRDNADYWHSSPDREALYKVLTDLPHGIGNVESICKKMAYHDVDDSRVKDMLDHSPNALRFDSAITLLGFTLFDILRILKSSIRDIGYNPSIDEEYEHTEKWKEFEIITSLELKQILLKNIPELFVPGTDRLNLGILNGIDIPGVDNVVNPPRSNCLAVEILERIRERDIASLFTLKHLLPQSSEEEVRAALQDLVQQGAVERVPEGFSLGQIPFKTIEEPRQDTSVADKTPEFNLTALERFEKEIKRVVSISSWYEPQCDIRGRIQQVQNQTVGGVLIKILLDGENAEDLITKMHERDIERLLEFCEDAVNPLDAELFSEYDIPANLFIFLFNRSPEYYRAISVVIERGEKSPYILLEGIIRDGLMINRTANSESLMDVRERFFSMLGNLENEIDSFSGDSPTQGVVNLLLFLQNDYDVEKSVLEHLIRKILGNHALERDSDGNPLFYPLPFIIESNKMLKYTSFNNAVSINKYLLSKIGPYAYTFDKLYLSTVKADDLCAFGIYGSLDLRLFLDKFGLLERAGQYITCGGSIERIIADYIVEIDCYNPNTVIHKFFRRFGESLELTNTIKSICEKLKMTPVHEVTFDGIDELRVILDGYEWITKTNAESLIEDKLGLKGRFNNNLMLQMGFKNEKDAYYREKYSSLRECLRQNEFSGEDIFIDNDLRIKFECRAFKEAVNYFCQILTWIPVSNDRYINLRSERFAYLYDALKTYRTFVQRICKEDFLTPFKLKNTPSGIPEIDDDIFDNVFYDAVLLSSRMPMSSIRGQHFCHDGSIDRYNCVIPDFLKYIIDGHEGRVSLSEIQDTLLTVYGIESDIPFIRQMLKQTNCIVINELDIVYSSEERYLEDITDD